ncbi:MAG: carbohydrate ABC transporter permease [Verrucomicrobia bacterium]|nr:carbohydrate ABC transporter permease [Kiritimatiellia bacterium]MCP5488024.1 carbohydrate ABC transporter permease [Verrucomicrobiota bacterium]
MALTPIHEIPIQEAHAKQVRRARCCLAMARTLFLYGLLVGGSAIFSIPFLWMIGTSIKVDREMFGEGISFLPMRPIPAQQSPYLDARYFKTSKGDQAAKLRAWITEDLQQRTLPLPAGVQVDPTEAAELLAQGVLLKLRDTLPISTWDLPDPDLRRTLLAHMDEALIADTLRKVYRFLAFGSVRVRSVDLQEKEMFTESDPTRFWTLESGSQEASFSAVEGDVFEQARLNYHFGEDPAPIRLSRTLTLPFQTERLHRIQVSVHPDDSWHRLDFYVEKNGVRYKSTYPLYLGTLQTTVVTLQEYGPDDGVNSTKLKLWYPYQEIDRGPEYLDQPNQVKVEVVMTPSSQLQAWWAKANRNYRGALNYIPFVRYFATSAFLVILNIIGNIFSCSIVAYSFARLQWPGRNAAFGLMMATLMIPPQVTMIPYFLIIKWLGWYNTLHPLWVISFFGNAFNIFLLRQFMKGIPRDLEDAARIDGCNFLQVYWHVIMPLIKPTLACIAIFTFMAVWNDFMGPLIYLSDQRLYPLSLGLYALNVQEGGNFGMMMAGSFLMTLPVVIIFFFAQKYFIQGVTLTGMKG